MEEPNKRLRLIIEVLPLPAEESDEAHRSAAMAAFKGRKFALPVLSEQTIGQVWRLIEERYKRNYLEYAEASLFQIKKLQDAYECDLDMSDTVGAVFEGEHDNQMRMIKVVPTYSNRMASLPPMSNLRPSSATKRAQDHSRDRGNKRRRVEALERETVEWNTMRNRPRPSVESGMGLFYSDNEDDTNGQAPAANGLLERSGTPDSLLVVDQSRTGLDEFDMSPKSGSPELGLPPPQHTTPRAPDTAKKTRKTRSDKGKKRRPRNPISPEHTKNSFAKSATPTTLQRPKRARRLSNDVSVELSSAELPRWTKLPDTAATNGTAVTPEQPGRLPKISMIASANLSSVKQTTPTGETENAVAGAISRSTSRRGRPAKAAQSALNKNPNSAAKRRGRPKKTTAPFVTSTDDESGVDRPEPTAGRKNTNDIANVHHGSRELSPDNASNGSAEQEYAEPESSVKDRTAKSPSSNDNQVADQESQAEDEIPNTNNEVVEPDPLETEPVETQDASPVAEPAEDGNASSRSELEEDENFRVAVEPSEAGDTSMKSDRAEEDDARVKVESKGDGDVSTTSDPAEEDNSRIEVEPTEDGSASVRSDVAEYDTIVVATERGEDSNPLKNQNISEDHNTLARVNPAEGDDAPIRPKPTDDGDADGRANPAEKDSLFGWANHGQVETVPVDAEPAQIKKSAVGKSASKVRKSLPEPEPRMTRGRTASAQGRQPAARESIAVAEGSVAVTRGRTATRRGGTIPGQEPTNASQERTTEQKANHRRVMELMYPNGVEIPEVEYDLGNLYRNVDFEDTRSKDTKSTSTKSKSRKAQKRSDITKVVERRQAEDLESERQQLLSTFTSLPIRDSAKFSSPEKDPIEDSQLSPAKPVAATMKSKPFNSKSWDFQSVHQPKNATISVEPVPAAASLSQPNAQHQESLGTTESELEEERETVDTNRRPNGAIDSARSSPEATRPPARYLSRSPTSDKSSGDDESDTSQSPSQSRAGSPEAANQPSESDSDDSSNEAEDENDEESEQEESEYENANKPQNGHKSPQLPSSPPQMPPVSTTLVPATQSSQPHSLSQRRPRGTPTVPSSNTPLASASQPTPSRRPVPRFASSKTNYQFGTISEQLKEVRTQKKPLAQPTKFDAKTQSLGKLKRGNMNGFGDSDSSDDDDESSSSSGEEVIKGRGGASCSVT